jgi:hypothetical protein
MPDRDDAALRDVHWKMYQENWTQARHHENQCLELAKALIAVAGAAIALISFKTGLVLRDLPLTVFVFLLGGLGAIFSAKQYERYVAHRGSAALHREELDRLLPGRPLGSIRDDVERDQRNEYPWLEHFPAQLNRGILLGARIGESIGIDSAWGGGRCRKPILGTCDSA